MIRHLFTLAAIIVSVSTYSQTLTKFIDPNSKRCGFKDSTGKVIIPALYDGAEDFGEDNYAMIIMGSEWYGGKKGIIDKNGKHVIPAQYTWIQQMDYNLFAVYKGGYHSDMEPVNGGKYAIFNSSGKALTGFLYEKVRPFTEGFSVLETYDKTKKVSRFGMIDSTGKFVLPVEYSGISDFENGIAFVGKNGKGGYINKSLKVIVPIKYEQLGGLQEGLIMAKLNGKYGFINTSGTTVIPFNYEEASGFYDGLSAVRQNNKWGFIDKAGKQIIAFKYDEAKDFEEGVAAAKLNDKWGVISKSDEIVHDFIYEEVIWTKNGGNLVRIKKGNQYLNINREGKEVKN